MNSQVLKKNTNARITLGIKADKRKYKLDNAAMGFSLIHNKEDHECSSHHFFKLMKNKKRRS